MNKEHFRELVNNRNSSGLSVTDELASLIEQFPYFQSARILYTKALFDQQHFKYNDQLKITAAYAGDRKVLHQFISEPRPTKTEILPVHESLTTNDILVTEETIYTHEIAPDLTIKSEEEFFEKPTDQNVEELREDFSEASGPLSGTEAEKQPEQSEELLIEKPIVSETEEKLTAIEIIELRIKEIGENKEVEDTDGATRTESGPYYSESDTETFEQSIKNEEEAIQSENVLSVEPENEQTQEIVFEAKIEYPEEVADNLPVMVNPDDSFNKSKHSFLDWLHQYEFLKKEEGTPEQRKVVTRLDSKISFEVPHFSEEPKNEKKVPVFDLIDRFITSEPRIDATKAKFYSPVNMAKNSIIDHDELVSETLALIYFEQGNLSKAIQTLEKLSLKFPEKSRYFADQIQILKNKSLQ